MTRNAVLFLLAPVMLLAGGALQGAPEGFVPGPDLVVGEMDDLATYGVNGTQRGLGIQATVCNAGNAEVRFVALPSTDHPVIAQNLYRMSGGSNSDERFEQVGQSWVKHTFGTGNADECGFGCIFGGDLTRMGPGCSDTYLSTQNATPEGLGSRAALWSEQRHRRRLGGSL